MNRRCIRRAGYAHSGAPRQAEAVRGTSAGFSLTELVVVMSLIAMLAVILLPAVNRARAFTAQAVCAANLRQLFFANTMYADRTGRYAPACPDLFTSNLQRWHGTRNTSSEPFNAARGAMQAYMDGKRTVRCPSFRSYRRDRAANAFEAACGGYGYNAVGVGSEIYLQGFRPRALQKGMKKDAIENPASTVMFADTAFPQPYGNSPSHLIEYSFAEPVYWILSPGTPSPYRADPTIHFRHRGRANVVWCDGHVSSEHMTAYGPSHFTDWNIGWFGSGDNMLFDPY